MSSSVYLLALAALVAAPAWAADPSAVTGKVLDPEGKRVGAASVYLIQQNGATGEAGDFRRVQTGSDGAFAFPSLPPEKEPSRLGVLAVKAGYGAWGTAIEPKGARSGLEIRLPPATELAGAVQDWAGRPLPGVRVRASHGNWSGWFALPERLDALSAVTDSAGRFHLQGLAEEAQVSLDFRHPRYARWGQAVKVAEHPRLAIRLRPAAHIVGRVSFEGSHRPAAGIQVSCRQVESAPTGYVAFGRAVTDRNGRFHLDGLWPGRYIVQLDYGDTPAQWVAVDREVGSVKEGRQAVCADLVLTRGGIVTGKVTDRETGAPLADARLGANRAEPGPWRPGPGTKTGPDGIYRLRVPPGKWQVHADWREGYLALWQEQQQQQPKAVTVAAGKSVAGPSFTLQRGAEVTGVVVNPNGRPDPRATLSGPYVWEQKVRPDGSFTLSGLRPDRPLTLAVRGSDRSLKATAEVTPRKGTSQPLTIRLARCAAVTGKVIDEKGQPLKNAEARAEFRIDIADGSWTMAPMDITRSDAGGRFTLWLLPGVTHEIKASAEGYGEARKPDFIAPDAGADLGALSVIPANRSISGRVTDPDGKPVAGVRVSAWGEGQPGRPGEPAVTDQGGHYRISGLAAGKVQVSVQHPSLGFDFRDGIETGATDIDFVLVPEQAPTRSELRLKPGDAAPEIRVGQWLTGQRALRLQDLRGRIIVLQFACAYNPAVETSSARLDALQRRYGRRGVTFLSIYDASLPAAETAIYIRARGVTHAAATVAATPQLGWNSPAFQRYGVHAVPSLFVIDRSGRIRSVNPSLADLEKALHDLTRSR